MQQQQQQERLNQLRQRLIQLQPQPQAQQPRAQAQQDAITALQQQLAEEREKTVALQNQKRELQRLNEEIKREQQAQEALQRQLVSIRSSDVFPESQSVRSTDVFPGSRAGFQFAPPPTPTEIWLSNLPPVNLYPTDLASQSAAIRNAQQMAQQPAAQLTILPPLVPPYQAAQPPPRPQVDDEYHFPEIADLGKFDNSYLEGVRQKLAKTINNVTWLISLDEGERVLTPEELKVLENRKAYKQTLLNYKDAFISYLKQRRENEEQMREQEQETVEEMMRKARQKLYGRGI